MKRSFHQTLNHTIMTVPVAAMMLGASQSQAVTSIGVNFWGSYGSANDGNNGRVVSAPAFGIPAANWGNSYVPPSSNPASWTYDSYVKSGNFTAGPVTVDYTTQGNWFTGITTENSPTLSTGETDVLNGAIVGGGTFGPDGAPGFKVTLTNLAATFPNGYVIQATTALDRGTGLAPLTVSNGTTTDSLSYGALRTVGGYYPAGSKWAIGEASRTFTTNTLTLSGPDDEGVDGIRSYLSGFVITDKLLVTDTNPPPVIAVMGSPVTLESGVIGIGTLSYQWRRNGTNVPGATSATYTIAAATLGDVGNYDVIVTSSAFPGAPVTSAIQIVTADLLWTGVVNGTWDLGTTPNWDSAGTATGYASPFNAVFDSSSTRRDVVLNSTVNPLEVRFADDVDYTLGGTGTIGGSARLAKSGQGTAAISLVNTFTGATTIAGGTLKITGGGSLGAGAYPGTIANAGNFVYDSTVDQAISGVISGTGTITKDGASTLTLTGKSNSSGLVTVNGGTLEVRGRIADNPYEIAAGGTLKIGYTTGGGYSNPEMKLHGAGVAATTGLYLAGGTSYNVVSTLSLLDAPTTIRQYGTGTASFGIFDSNKDGLYSTAAASGSVVDANIDFISRGYGMAAKVDVGTETATGDLIFNGPLNVSASAGIGFVKRGDGSLRLNAAGTAVNQALAVAGGSVISGINEVAGINADVSVSGGGRWVLNGTSQSIKKLTGDGRVVGGAATASVLTIKPDIDGDDATPDATFAGIIGGPNPDENNVIVNKTGPNTLIMSGASTYGGLTTVSGGTLEVLAKGTDSPYEVPVGSTLKIGYSTGGGYAASEIKLHGSGLAATTGLYLAGGTSYNVSGVVRLLDAPTTVRQYGTGLAGMGIFDINGTGLLSTAAASGSVIDSNIQFVSRGYGMTTTIESGANTATGDLIVNGPLNIVGGGFGLVKKGPGSLQLNATATSLNEGLRIDAGTVFLGAADAIGSVGDLTVAGGSTLVLNGHSQSAKKLSGAGAIVNRSATLATLTLSPASDGGDDPADATYSGVIGGAGTNENAIALVKTGVNALTLSGANTYTGNTTVAEGKLTVNSAFFDDGADVILTTGATLELNTGVTDTVDELIIDGIAQAGGEWGPDGSGAARTSPLLTGSGKLFVMTGGVGGSGYLEWISGEPYNLTGSDARADADPDGDGIPNAIEFVLGGNPASASDSALAPTVALVTADVGNGSTAYFKFTFHRSEISAAIVPVVKYNSDLSSTWASAVHGTAGVVINPVAGNNVEVYIPRSLAQGGKLFARLSVTL